MNIVIVSIDHRFQLVRSAPEMPWDGLRDKLEALVQKTIRERNVAFIGEEAHPNPGRPTIAQQVASTNEPRIPWRNVDMPEAERRAAGICDALRDRPCRVEWRGAEAVAIEHRIPEDDIREDFMVRKVLEWAGKAQSVLVLCGDMHTRALKQKFEKQAVSAETDESLITAKNWTG